MKKLEFIDLEACEEAADWASGKTWKKVYTTCHRGDWLLWLFAKTNPNDLRELTLAKGHCANTVRHLMKDERSIAAVDAAIAFGDGKITKEELDAAANNTYAAYSAYSSVNTAYAAAYPAAYPAAALSAAAFASAAAANTANANAAAYAAADAAYADAAYAAAYPAAAYADAKKENQQQTADICRKCLPIEMWNIKN